MTVPNGAKDGEFRGSGVSVKRGEGIVGAILLWLLIFERIVTDELDSQSTQEPR